MKSEIELLLDKLYHPDLKLIDPGLDRVYAFLELIGAPHRRIPPVIHIAGTNGKGSLVAYLHAIFEAAGYRVHRYTSPHLVRFNERIVIAGTPIDDDYLRQLLETLMGYIENQPVTFFEATTAAAFMAFSDYPADIVLLETGMGGKLDATNVIDAPLLTAITPIGLDHCNFLGDTIEAVAGEKAGIIKAHVPCVVGKQETKALAVIEQAALQLHAPLYRQDHEWHVRWEGEHAHYESAKRRVVLTPALAGRHQMDNAATAVACVDMLKEFSISDAQIAQGLSQAVWPARLQHLTSGRYVKLVPPGMELWLDGGHNPHGASALAGWMEKRGITEIYAICGMVKDKDTMEFLKILAPYLTKLYAVTIPDEPTSKPAQQVQMSAQGAGIVAESAPSIENALQTIAAHAKTPSIICICGSLYLAGKVLAEN